MKKKLKILYAIQGTGNGHLARATEIVPMLKEMGQVDVLVSGIQGDIELPFKVDFQFYGISFIFGKNGGVSLSKTLLRLRPIRFLIDLIRFPVKNYDIILCDFEPVSAWACRVKRHSCIGVSHQNAVLHPLSPTVKKKDWLGRFILLHYAPVTKKYGFHFTSLDQNNFGPVIRSTIREAKVTNEGHYTVYLPAYSNEEIETVLFNFPDVKWEVFSKHNKLSYQKKNIRFSPISLDDFTQSFTSCAGILCTAGFETPAEAIFMGKKLCVIPMKNQYEQACNAAFLTTLKVRVLPELRNQLTQLKEWLNESQPLQINYPNVTQEILEQIISTAE